MRDIFWAQATLADELAARVAHVIDPDERDEIAVHQSAIAAGDVAHYTRIGRRFHRAVNLAAKSPRSAVMLGTMTKQLLNRLYGMVEGQVQGTLDYHPRIFESIVAREAEATLALMIEYIVSDGELLVPHLEHEGIRSRETAAS